MDNFNVSQKRQATQAKIVAFRLSPEHRHADFIFDLEFNGLIVREVQGRHDKTSRLTCYLPPVTAMQDGVKKRVPSVWFTSHEGRAEFQQAARIALTIYFAKQKFEAEKLEASHV